MNLCSHIWEQGKGLDSDPCTFCSRYASFDKRAQCSKCYRLGCVLCLEQQGVNFSQPKKTDEKVSLSSQQYETLLQCILTLEQRVSLLERTQLKGKSVVEEETELVCIDQTISPQDSHGNISIPIRRNPIWPLRDITCRVRLYPESNFLIETLALINSGCTQCTIDEKIVPPKYHRKAKTPRMSIQMDGTSFLQDTIMCPSSPEFVHQPGIRLSMPTVWIRNLNLDYGIIIGLNFLLDKSGTFILTPDSFHISRKTISIPTQPTQLTSELTAKRGGTLDIQNPNLDVSLALLSPEEEFEFFEYSSEAKDSISESTEYVVLPRTIKPVKTTISLINTFFALGSIKNQEDLDQILHELDVLKIIGEDPLAHWSKNEIECHLVIKNPDYIISGAQIEFSNLDQEECKTQIDELLKLKIISPSMSKHRSAFMVRNHSEIKRGKARMVINYKRLNDNTEEDSYNLPMKSQLINAIQKAKIFSKFDLKSGFYQIKMSQESKPWTAFTCSEGLFEWNAMSFGLKNAPAVFQRKMDNIFKDVKSFVAVYIDNVLVFSPDYNTHLGHLQVVFKKFIDHGLIVCKKKIELANQ